jgi:serine/threonine protein kinase/WD40 repeat protein
MSTSGSESRSGLVMELAEEFLDRYRKGQRPPLREYIENHHELAGEIREVFPAMAMMENIALADESLEGDATGDLPVRRPPPLEQLGDYRIVREVGRGGMGVVYEAEQVSLGRHVALKVLPPQMLRDARTRRRFEREARAAAKLHHTNIVPVFGVGEQDETPYYVMQFIQGQGLDVVLGELRRLRAGGAGLPAAAPLSTVGRDVSAADVARSLLTGRLDAQPTEGSAPDNSHGPAGAAGSDSGHASSLSASSLTLPGGEPPRGKARRQTYWQGVARIGVQVADALAYAHAQGIVHRDIKPSNLLLDTHGIVWVTDFGLAKADDQQNLTHTGDILGTLRYMPPEAFGGKVDSRGDVYALGLTLYEMLAFRPAFEEKERGRLVKQVTGEAPAPLRKLNSEVPRDLETIVQKAIEREPSHRYASASELADDLRRFVDDEPIRARRASYAERLARWGRRNPVLAALSGAVAVLGLVVICGLWYGNQSARRALKVQTALRGEADAQTAEARRAAAAAADANRSLTSAQDSLRRILYAAQINLAQSAWDSGSPGRTLELLEATRPKPGEPDFRGFEWDYFRRQAHGERSVRKLYGFRDFSDASLIQFGTPSLSADGALAAIVDRERGRGNPAVVVIRDTATGRLVREIPVSDPFYTRLAFSADGTRIAMVSVRTGRADDKLLPDGNHAVVWSLADGRELFQRSWSSVSNSYFSSPDVALDRTGARIALGTSISNKSRPGYLPDSRIDLRVIDVADGRERIHLTSADRCYTSPQLSPDGRLLAAVEHARDASQRMLTAPRLRVLEVEGGRDLEPLGDLANHAHEGRFSPDGRLLAMTTMKPNAAPELVLYDLQAGRIATREVLSGAFGTSPTSVFSPDGCLLVLASRDGPACQVRAMPTGQLLHATSLGSGGLCEIAVLPSARILLTLDSNGNVRQWPLPSAGSASLDSGRVLQRISGAKFADGGRKLIALEAAGDPNRPARLTETDVATGRVLHQLERSRPDLPAPIGTLQTFEVCGSGSALALRTGTSEDRPIQGLEIWNFASGQRLPDVDGGVLGSGFRVGPLVSPQAFDAQGTRLALHTPITVPGASGKNPVHRGSAISILELPSGRLLRTIPNTRSFGLLELALRPDGKLLAHTEAEFTAGGESRPMVMLFDPDSGQLVRTLHSPWFSMSTHLVVFSPDGRWIGVAGVRNWTKPSQSSPVLVWDLSAGGDPEPLRLDGHVEMIGDLAFSADGRRLATAASRGTQGGSQVKLWDLASGRGLVTWNFPGDGLLDLAFDPDGQKIRALLWAGPEHEVRIALLDASPLDPDVEAIDVIDRLDPDVRLNSELAERIQAEPGLDPAVRAAALAAVPLRHENALVLLMRARRWLEAPEHTPELMRRALVYIERACELERDLNYAGLASLGEARYRNGQLAECLEPLRRSLARQAQDNPPAQFRTGRSLAFIAMAEAKLGHRAGALAALDEYRSRRAREFAGSKGKPPEDPLLAEAEAVLRAAFGVPPAADPTPALVPKP